ncbi:MAG: NAD-dependent epimerase/dehydratase family protein [Methylobacter sp.]|nr:NAD-dependent epimerase/dehydratase family protein [Methylobacter sp.]
MATKFLVLGGTNLIGPALVSRLLEDGADVTIATRGITLDPFEDTVTRVRIDRTNQASLQTLAALGPWDVIYDQICYTESDAKAACESFAGHVGRYIFTSSIMIYAPGSDRTEDDFNPYNYQADSNAEWSSLPQHLRYAQGKRAAEATFSQQAKFPVTAVRFPNILGTNDPSRRLDWHIAAVQKHSPIFVPSPDVRQSLVWSQDAGRFLRWLGSHHHTGRINAALAGPISIGNLLLLIATIVGSPVIYAKEQARESYSPFGFSEDFTIGTQLVELLGVQLHKGRRLAPSPDQGANRQRPSEFARPPIACNPQQDP